LENQKECHEFCLDLKSLAQKPAQNCNAQIEQDNAFLPEKKRDLITISFLSKSKVNLRIANGDESTSPSIGFSTGFLTHFPANSHYQRIS